MLNRIEGSVKTADEFRTYKCPRCSTIFKIRPMDMLVDHWVGRRYCKCPKCGEEVGYGVNEYEDSTGGC